MDFDLIYQDFNILMSNMIDLVQLLLFDLLFYHMILFGQLTYNIFKFSQLIRIYFSLRRTRKIPTLDDFFSINISMNIHSSFSVFQSV